MTDERGRLGLSRNEPPIGPPIQSGLRELDCEALVESLLVRSCDLNEFSILPNAAIIQPCSLTPSMECRATECAGGGRSGILL